MLEVKINIHCPELVTAITSLADAITRRAPSTQLPVGAPANPTVPPVAAPATGTVQSAPYATATPAPAPTSVPPAAPAAPLFAAPVSNAPAPTVPVANAPAYTLDQISRAGAALVDAGKMPQLVTLLGKYGVRAVTQIPPERYGDFATELRGLGARL